MSIPSEANEAVLAAIRLHERVDDVILPGVANAPLDLATLGALAGRSPTPTASIIIPARNSGENRQHDHQQARHLVHEARGMLEALVGDGRAATIIAPALALIDHPTFWSRPNLGMALFCADDGCTQVWIPGALPGLALVGGHCHVKPLLRGLQEDGRFYLLELGQHGVHFHQGSRFSLKAIALPGAQAALEETIGHAGTGRIVKPAGAAEGVDVPNFGPISDERSKLRIKQCFRRLDACVCAFLHAERAPLLTAGADSLLPLYWEVNRYPRLIEAGIVGNPDLMPTAALNARAWEVVAPHFTKAADEARDRYLDLRGSPRTSEDLATILLAAAEGRMEDLFVAGDSERWGTIDAVGGRLREHEPRQPADEDLLNVALLKALGSRAGVHVLPLADMPGGKDIAAVFRY